MQSKLRQMLIAASAGLTLSATGLAHAQDALAKAQAAYEREDYAGAANWLRVAADQGDAKAQYNLGVMHEAGQGVPQNNVEAVNWYRKAAERGNADAQSNLGAMYANGEGVAEDYVEAHKWWGLAAAQGVSAASTNMDRLRAKMTSAQLDEAQRLSRERPPASPR